MGGYLMEGYNTDACAAKCRGTKGCLSFNIFFERDPIVTPNHAHCPNPPTFPALKCTLWAGTTEPSTATYTGHWRSKFRVVVAGSNGYTVGAPEIPGYTGPDNLGNAAIHAPLDCHSDDTYMGYQFFTDGVFDVGKCAAACTAASEPCTFFNTYILFKNNQPLGQYCTMYTQPWDSSCARTADQDQYTIGYSFSYYNTTNSGLPVCPSDISYLEENGKEFCTSFNNYDAPVATAMDEKCATITKCVVVTETSTAVVSTTSTTTTTAFATTTQGVSATETSTTTTATTTSTTTTPELATITEVTVVTETSTATVTTVVTLFVIPTAVRKRGAVATPLAPLRTGATIGQLSPAALYRHAVATPASVSDWSPSKISEACSKVCTSTTDPPPCPTVFSTSTTTTTATATITIAFATTTTSFATVSSTSTSTSATTETDTAAITITGPTPFTTVTSTSTTTTTTTETKTATITTTDPTPLTTVFSTTTTTTATTETTTSTFVFAISFSAKFAISGIPGVDKGYVAAGYPLVYSTDESKGLVFNIGNDGYFSSNNRFADQDRGLKLSNIYLDPREDIGPGGIFAPVLAAVQPDGAIRLNNTETQAQIVQTCGDTFVLLGTYVGQGCTEVRLSADLDF